MHFSGGEEKGSKNSALMWRAKNMAIWEAEALRGGQPKYDEPRPQKKGQGVIGKSALFRLKKNRVYGGTAKSLVTHLISSQKGTKTSVVDKQEKQVVSVRRLVKEKKRV